MSPLRASAFRLLCVVALVTALAGCRAAENATADDGSATASELDVTGLLIDRGYEVRQIRFDGEFIEGSLGHLYEVEGFLNRNGFPSLDYVYVWAFESEAEAVGGARDILSRNSHASPIGRTVYRKGELVVEYRGGSPILRKDFESVLGAPLGLSGP